MYISQEFKEFSCARKMGKWKVGRKKVGKEGKKMYAVLLVLRRIISLEKRNLEPTATQK